MRQRGFTLIELLVVIAVMGAVLALVGPFGKEQVARFERLSEVRILESLFKSRAKQAFLSGTSFKLTLSGKSILVHNLNDNTLQSINFEYLFFLESTVFIRMNGVYSSTSIKYVVDGQPRLLSLSSSDEAH